jgi:hypothetical protein
MHIPCFMLNTWPSHKVLKVSTLGFQTCLHMTFHILKGVMEGLRCDRLNLTLDVVSQVLQCLRPISIHTTFENAPYEEVWWWNHASSVNHTKSRIPGCSLRNAWSHRQCAHTFHDQVLSTCGRCDAVGMNLGFLGGSLACWLGHASLLWQSTQGFLRRVFHLYFDASVFAQLCFVFSMKLGTCVINFMLLNVLVGKLYWHFWVRKLVGHSVRIVLRF